MAAATAPAESSHPATRPRPGAPVSRSEIGFSRPSPRESQVVMPSPAAIIHGALHGTPSSEAAVMATDVENQPTAADSATRAGSDSHPNGRAKPRGSPATVGRPKPR